MGSILDLIYQEASAYSSLDKIEALVEQGESLENIPVQPLFFALKKMPLDQRSLYLEKLSPKQRKTMLSIDLWNKDRLDVDSFYEWFLAYAYCPNDSVRREFIKTEQFLLFFKARFSIYTFDVEDPVYPDHDNYFLTEDNQLLIEFDDDFIHVNELKQLIGELYDEMGVEGAYTYLFKMVADSFLQFIEDSYQQKIKELDEVGIVDYYKSLELLAHFPSLSVLNLFIKKKIMGHEASLSKGGEPNLNMLVHDSYIIKVKDRLNSVLAEELNQVEDEHIQAWLKYDFIRMVNAKMVFEGQLKQDPVTITQQSKELAAYVLLGFSYVKELFTPNQSIFNIFTFTELYRIGFSLIRLEVRRAEKVVGQYPKEMENFWGQVLNSVMENLLEKPVVVGEFSAKTEVVNNYQLYQRLQKDTSLVVDMLPIVYQFFKVFKDLVDKAEISSQFYLNYSLEEIDFEALLLSSFINFSLGFYDDPAHAKKLGVKVSEFQDFLQRNFGKVSFDMEAKKLPALIEQFLQKYGLDQCSSAKSYFWQILKENLSGYDFEHLSYDDFRHVGGVIFFNEN